MDQKTFSCSNCPNRPTCVQVCPRVEEILAKEQRNFEGREVLVEPYVIAAIYAKGYAPALRDMSVEKLRCADLQVVPGMTGRQFNILRMTYVDGQSQRAIARRLGISQTTVGEHLHAARKKVRVYIHARQQSKITPPTYQHKKAPRFAEGLFA